MSDLKNKSDFGCDLISEKLVKTVIMKPLILTYFSDIFLKNI